MLVTIVDHRCKYFYIKLYEYFMSYYFKQLNNFQAITDLTMTSKD